jgi:hypothetical protein
VSRESVRCMALLAADLIPVRRLVREGGREVRMEVPAVRQGGRA